MVVILMILVIVFRMILVMMARVRLMNPVLVSMLSLAMPMQTDHHRPGTVTEISDTAAERKDPGERHEGEGSGKALGKGPFHQHKEAQGKNRICNRFLESEAAVKRRAPGRERPPLSRVPGSYDYREQCPQLLQQDEPPLLVQTSAPPLQQQLAFAQQLPPPPVVTQEVRVKRAAPEAAMMMR